MGSVDAAVVTGAASGIGRAISVHLMSQGWSVTAIDCDEVGLGSLSAQTDAGLLTVAADIASSTEVDAAFAAGLDAFGPARAAVAAAGIWTPGTVADLNDEQWNRALAVNLTGTFNTARAAVAQLAIGGAGGAFVAIASDVGVQGSQGCAAYVAAKHAVVGLVRSMALDFGSRGIRSNAVCPGFVETAMAEQVFRDASPELIRSRHSEVPLGRFATPDEVATVVGALVDHSFSFVNGAALLVDGGATAGYYTPATP